VAGAAVRGTTVTMGAVVVLAVAEVGEVEAAEVGEAEAVEVVAGTMMAAMAMERTKAKTRERGTATVAAGVVTTTVMKAATTETTDKSGNAPIVAVQIESCVTDEDWRLTLIASYRGPPYCRPEAPCH
jgi:hypothetical protein